MGILKQTIGAYLKCWNSAVKIKAQFEQFRLETQTILTALTRRFTREDQELSEMADQRSGSSKFPQRYN